MATPRVKYPYNFLYDDGSMRCLELTNAEAEEVFKGFERGVTVVWMKESKRAIKLTNVQFIGEVIIEDEEDLNYKENIITLDLNSYPEEYRETFKKAMEDPFQFQWLVNGGAYDVRELG